MNQNRLKNGVGRSITGSPSVKWMKQVDKHLKKKACRGLNVQNGNIKTEKNGCFSCSYPREGHVEIEMQKDR